MILLDANFLLELIISGRKHKTKALNYLQNIKENFCVSMLSVHLVLHFGLEDGLSLDQIKKFLADYPKIALLPEDYFSALKVLRDKDHEDAMQLVIAKRAGCSHIVTLDKKFSQTYRDLIEFSVIGN